MREHEQIGNPIGPSAFGLHDFFTLCLSFVRLLAYSILQYSAPINARSGVVICTHITQNSNTLTDAQSLRLEGWFDSTTFNQPSCSPTVTCDFGYPLKNQ